MGLTEIVSTVLTAPEVGETESQGAVVAAVKVRVAPGLMMVVVCEGGAPAPGVKENENESGLARIGDPEAPEETF